MSKKIILGVVAIVIVIVSIFILTQKKTTETEQIVLSNTVTISKQYVLLRYETNDLLVNAKDYGNYGKWSKEMEMITQRWKTLESEAVTLEKMAGEMSEEKVSLIPLSTVYAYDKQEISNVFDKAPAGKKIATLAKYLGVDAKRAQAILNQDQAQVTADAWNEAGDTFKKLETSAVVIKDGCKVAGFVGTIALTGGTSALAAGSTLTKVAVVVSGADLTLEVTSDGAKIALGDKNKLSSVIGDVRTVTEPAAAILMIADLPKNMTKGIDKLNAVIFGADQLNSTIQNGSVIGIKLPAYSKDKSNPPTQVSVMASDEVEKWIAEQGATATVENIEEIKEILEVDQAEVKEDEKAVEQAAKEVRQNSVSLEGTSWAGTLQNTAGGSKETFTHEWNVVFEKDGRLSGKSGSGKISSWKMDGDKVQVFGEDISNGYLQFQLSGDRLILSLMSIGGENITAGEEYMGGKALSGELVRK